MRIQNMTLLTLFLCATVSALQGADNGVGCLRLEVMPPGSGDDAGGFRLTNECGKDITAYRLVFREPADGSEAGAVAEELLGLLATQPSDILRNKKSTRVMQLSFGPTAVPSVAAVIFIDRSTLGDPSQVALLIANRNRTLERFKERLNALNSVSDWSAALNLRSRAEEIKPRNHPLGRYLEDLARQQERSDISSWDAFVARERNQLQKSIELFKYHLGKRTGVTP